MSKKRRRIHREAKNMTMEKETPVENAEVQQDTAADEIPVQEEQTAAAPQTEAETSPETKTDSTDKAQPDECAQKLDELSAALEASQKTAEQYLNMAQRVQADFDNYRRRNQNSIRESFDDGAFAFASTLLPVLDNLERAIQAAKDSPDESLRSGVEMVCRQLTEAFSKRGIHCIECLGKPFDPNLENAIMQGSAEDGEPGTVCEIFQKGYQMNDRLLRAAMVKVVPD